MRKTGITPAESKQKTCQPSHLLRCATKAETAAEATRPNISARTLFWHLLKPLFKFTRNGLAHVRSGDEKIKTI